jgi:glycosyltransferase involved in cell wall biosynthesis
MNVAILGIKTLPAVAGADRVVEKLLENFSTEHDYWVYLRKDSSSVSCHDNLHFIHVPALRGKHLGSFSYFFLCCVHYLLKGRYDLAHVHNSDFGLFVPLLRLKLGVPVLGTFHGDPYSREKWGSFAKLYLRLSECFFVQFCQRVSSVSRFKDQVRGLWTRKAVTYIPNGVDPYFQESHPESLDLADFGLEPRAYLLFACGRLDSTKGLHHLLAAWGSVDTTHRLCVVGDFSHDATYSARVDAIIEADPSIHAHRRLLGREALLELVRNCVLFVFPSEYEAMSMMLLEAISCMRPVLCSDIPPNLELLVPGYPYVYRTGDDRSLAERLEAALADPELERWSEKLYERCMRDYAWGPIAAEYEELYREASGGSIAPASASMQAHNGST